MTLDEYFSTGPERERPIFEAVMAHVRSLGEVHVEPGLGRHLHQAGPGLRRAPPDRCGGWRCRSRCRAGLDHPRIARLVTRIRVGRTYHVVNLRDAEDVDDEVRELLTLAWFDLG